MLRVMNLYCEGDESRNAVQLQHTFCQNILTITSLGAAPKPVRQHAKTENPGNKKQNWLREGEDEEGKRREEGSQASSNRSRETTCQYDVFGQNPKNINKFTRQKWFCWRKCSQGALKETEKVQLRKKEDKKMVYA